MKKILTFCLFASLFFVTGCTGPRKLMNGWIGKPKELLYKTWGDPAKMVNNGTAGTILIYSEKSEVYEAPGIYLSFEGDGYNKMAPPPVKENKQYTKLKLFYINPAGIIYSWKLEDI